MLYIICLKKNIFLEGRALSYVKNMEKIIKQLCKHLGAGYIIESPCLVEGELLIVPPNEHEPNEFNVVRPAEAGREVRRKIDKLSKNPLQSLNRTRYFTNLATNERVDIIQRKRRLDEVALLFRLDAKSPSKGLVDYRFWKIVVREVTYVYTHPIKVK